MAKKRSSKGRSAAATAHSQLRALLRAQPKSACYDDVIGVAFALYHGIDTPVSRRLLAALATGDGDYIANATISHENYSSVDSFYVDYCAVSFLRKWEDLGNAFRTGLDPERSAIETFFRAEAVCRSTNEVFAALQLGEFCPKPEHADVLLRARKLIKDCLGRNPRVQDLQPRFGPGATSQCSGESVTIADKLLAFPECTMDAVPLVANLPMISPAWFHLLAKVHPNAFYDVAGITDDFGDFIYRKARVAPKLVRGNRFTTVPKTAKTHRGICIEPHSNSIFQLAIGSYITDCLARFGLPKDQLQAVHRRLAREASITGALATIDLSMASDTVSYELVRYLLPSKWFELLASLRSPETFIEGKWVELEKFSSMGNGYTFELETLIFYALARATVDHLGLSGPVSAYGDDIIIPAGASSLFYEILHLCGFIVNPDKSFVACGFNESCGGDYLAGADVRPYFVKESPNDPISWTTLVNGIRRMAVKNSHHGELDPRFVGAWLRAIARIPKPLRFHGPPADGDWWIHTTDSTRWYCRTKGGVRRFRALVPQPRIRKWERYCPTTVYTCALYGAKSEGLALRGAYRKLRVKWLPS